MNFKLEPLPQTSERIRDALAIYKKANIYRYTNQVRYVKYINGFYKEEAERRFKNAQAAHKNIKAQEIILSLIAQRKHILDWMVDWCWTYDPRNANLGLPPAIPWIPWPRQIEFIEWFYSRYLSGEDGLVEKSRDAGATWLFCLVFLREWRWEAGFAAGVGSKKLNDVDQKENPRAVFVKLRNLLYHQPTWWFPSGFIRNKNDKVANLFNPEIETSIAGEGGDDIGRGDRRSVYLIDEKAFLEHPDSADSALSQTTNSQFDLSTPNGMNNFGKKRHSGRVKVFTFHWRSDSRKDVGWYNREKARLDPVILAREVDIDYQASVEGLMIEPKWIEASVDLKFEPVGVRSAGLDVAAGGKNKSALTIRKGPVFKTREWNIKNGIRLTHKASEECNKHGVSYLNYDKLGVGFAVRSAVELNDEDDNPVIIMNFKHFGVDAGGTASEVYYKEFDRKGFEIFFNARAEWWYNMARRFEKTYEYVTDGIKHPIDQLITIENDPKLKTQLASPMKMWTTKGKMKVESKDQMKTRDIESPDMADSAVMANIPQDAGFKHVLPGYNGIFGQEDANFTKFTIDWSKSPEHIHKHYAAFYQQKDLSVHLVCSIFDQVTGNLFIYKDMLIKTVIPTIMAPRLTKIMRLHTLKFDKFLANEIMFNDRKRSLARLFKLEFRKLVTQQDVKLKPPKRYDQAGSIAIVNEMILRDRIWVNESCKETNRQLSNWKIIKGKPVEDNYGMCMGILMIVSELKQIIPIKAILKGLEYTTRLEYEEIPVKEYQEEDHDQTIGPQITI